MKKSPVTKIKGGGGGCFFSLYSPHTNLQAFANQVYIYIFYILSIIILDSIQHERRFPASPVRAFSTNIPSGVISSAGKSTMNFPSHGFLDENPCSPNKNPWKIFSVEDFSIKTSMETSMIFPHISFTAVPDTAV